MILKKKPLKEQRRDDLIEEISHYQETATKAQIITDMIGELVRDGTHSDICAVINFVAANLTKRIAETENNMAVAHERIGYIVKYLDGKMYNTEADAKNNLAVQLRNAKDAYERTVRK